MTCYETIDPSSALNRLLSFHLTFRLFSTNSAKARCARRKWLAAKVLPATTSVSRISQKSKKDDSRCGEVLIGEAIHCLKYGLNAAPKWKNDTSLSLGSFAIDQSAGFDYQFSREGHVDAERETNKSRFVKEKSHAS